VSWQKAYSVQAHPNYSSGKISMQRPQQEDKDELPITPSRLLDERKVIYKEKIQNLKARIKSTLLSYFNGKNVVVVETSKEDPMVVTEALKAFQGGEGNDNWKIERKDGEIRFSASDKAAD